jgi:UDP-N-acetylglucosamine 4,6-dehydratase
LSLFENKINELRNNKAWKKDEIVDSFFKMIPGFGHKETGKYLDSKM